MLQKYFICLNYFICLCVKFEWLSSKAFNQAMADLFILGFPPHLGNLSSFSFSIYQSLINLVDFGIQPPFKHFRCPRMPFYMNAVSSVFSFSSIWITLYSSNSCVVWHAIGISLNAAFSFHFSICVLPLAVLLYRAISRWIKSKASVNGEYNLPTLDITLWSQVVFTEMNQAIFCSDHDFRSFLSLLFNAILVFQW